MPFYEREEKLISLLGDGGVKTVDEIAKRLYVSLPTVRRDLNKLEKKGIIKRTHGGAVLHKSSADEKIPIVLRENEQSIAKVNMAKKAVCFIENGYTIMVDGSTSALAIIPLLADFENLIVITNSAKASILLGQMGIKNISTGGNMILKSFVYVGDDAKKSLEKYNCDVAFFSCRGLSLNGYVTDNSVDENVLRRVMMERSKKSVLLCDQSKLGKTCLNNLCRISEIDEIICDGKIPEEILALKN